MATIYTILGTDSISSSRLHLNNNFDSINTELTDVSLLLDTSAQNLTITGNVSAYDGTFTNNLNVTNTATLAGAVNITGNLSMSGAITQSVVGAASVLPTTNASFNHHTYLITPSGQNLSLKNGTQGQEIMICTDNTGGQTLVITASSGNLALYNTISFAAGAYKHVTLRYVNSIWYVVDYSTGVTPA